MQPRSSDTSTSTNTPAREFSAGGVVSSDGQAVVVVIGLLIVIFIMIHLVPGDPVEVRTGEHGISPERLAMFRHQLGLDQPVWKQFSDYAWSLMHGDFGTSLSTSGKVLTEFLPLFPATVELSFVAMLLAVVLGIPMGVFAAVRRGAVIRRLGDVVVLMPPLAISEHELRRLVAITASSIAETGIYPARDPPDSTSTNVTPSSTSRTGSSV